MNSYSDTPRGSEIDILAITREAKYLNRLPASQLLRLTMAGTMVDFPGESLILQEGAPIEAVYMILRGMVSVGLYSSIDPSMWMYVSGPGSVVDMCALLDPPVSPVTIRALTDVEALAIPRDLFVEVIQEEPALGYEILQSLASRLVLINRTTLREAAQEYPGPSLN